MQQYLHVGGSMLLVALVAAQDSHGECRGDLPILRLVMENQSEAAIVAGRPKAPSLLTEGTYRSFQRWREIENCCTDDFVARAQDALDAQRSEIHRFRSAVSTMFDRLLSSPEVLDKITTEPTSLTLSIDFIRSVREEVVPPLLSYVDNCEDPLRLFFAATTSELCSSTLPSRLTEGKYLHVHESVCDGLWQRPNAKTYVTCSRAPDRVLYAAEKLGSFCTQLQKTYARRNILNAQAMGTVDELLLASLNLKRLATRVAFYHDRDLFCARVAREGFAYRSSSWGHLSLYDGSSAGDEKGPLARPADIVGLENYCVHGFSTLTGCVCDPCFVGEQCDVPRIPGPIAGQSFASLVANDDAQVLVLAGCEFPRDLQSSLARIKFVATNESNNALEQCLARPASAFDEMPFVVPFLSSDRWLRYKISVPRGSKATYQLCYCYGAFCDMDDASWTHLGEVVVRNEHAAPGARFRALPERGLPHNRMTSCDMNWVKVDMPDIDFTRHGEQVFTFSCKHGFDHIEGPTMIECREGAWVVQKTTLDLVDNASSTIPWSNTKRNYQLPFCYPKSMNYSCACSVDKVAKDLLGGITVFDKSNGVARSRCNMDRSLHIGNVVVRGKSIEQRCGQFEEPLCERVGHLLGSRPPFAADRRDALVLPLDSKFTLADEIETAWHLAPKVAEEHLLQDASIQQFGELQQLEEMVRLGRKSMVDLKQFFMSLGEANISEGELEVLHKMIMEGSEATTSENEVIPDGGASPAVPAEPRRLQEASLLQEAEALQFADNHTDVSQSVSRTLPADRPVRITPWPIVFTRDEAANPFVIDECLLFLHCSSLGNLPSDTAASMALSRSSPSYARSNWHTWSLPLVVVLAVAARSLASAEVRTWWASRCGKRLALKGSRNKLPEMMRSAEEVAKAPLTSTERWLSFDQ